jgi:predicted RNase H-like HicB family nuclease/DNA-binding XRE family transcriptional regulator
MSRNGKARTAPVLLEGSYYARITKQRGGGYLVEFPDLSGCLTEGKDLKTALANAREALSGWLFVALKHGDHVPAGRVRHGRGYHRIVPDLDVSVPLVIRMGRQRRGLTQRQVAAALGISQQAYQRLESPGKSNPTLKTLDRLSGILGLEFHLEAA